MGYRTNVTVSKINWETACPDCHDVMCSMPPLYLGICFRTDGYKMPPRQPSHMWLQSHGIETGPPHSLHLVHLLSEMGDVFVLLGWSYSCIKYCSLKIKYDFWFRCWTEVSSLHCSLYHPKTWLAATPKSFLGICIFTSSIVHWSKSIQTRCASTICVLSYVVIAQVW